MPDVRSTSIEIDWRPFTLNGERKLDRFARAALVSTWRTAFKALAMAPRRPPFEVVQIIATPHMKSRSGLQDTGGCFPSVKAAIDGLVDAGLLPSDGPDVVRRLTFNAPVFDGRDALVIEVLEFSDAQ